MRIRSIKPEFWRSSDISQLNVEDRLLFIGLWSYVDDNGVGIDKLSSISADLFADDLERDPSETFARVSRGLANLSEAKRIVRYTVGDRDFLQIQGWSKHQRIDKPARARFPEFSAENQRSDNDSRECRESVARVPEKNPVGTGEQRNRGTEEQGNSSSSSVAATAPPRPDVTLLLDHFDASMETLDVKRPPRTKSNVNAMRLLIDKDNRTVEEIKWVIDWSREDPFWQGIIHTPAKLRDKYDQLRIKASATKASAPNRVAEAFDIAHQLYAQETGAYSDPFLEIES